MAPTPRRRALGAAARTAVAVALGFVAVLVIPTATAEPASAHGLGGPEPTDVLVTVTGLRPPTPGISVRAIDLGTQVELRNRSTGTVVVLGYEGEPYLRVDRRGVWENRRAPATALNRSDTPTGTVPPGLDATAPPDWVRISASPVARWHDHRAHWMGRGAVRDEPWEIPVRVDGTRADIVGSLDTRPTPATAAWLGLAAALALTIGLLSGLRRWPAVLAVGLVIVVASETLHTIGAWSVSSAGPGARVLGAAPSILAILIAVGALGRLAERWRNPDAATPLILVAGLFLAIAGGIADLGSLTHAVVPSDLDPLVVRLTIAIALGGGVGLAIGAARHLRPVGVVRAPTAVEG
ncbi:MAG: hypothetical protein ACKOZL_05230 [Actinomycetes bacterium]